MGKQSTRANKTIYQLCREAAGLTRAEASDKMKLSRILKSKIRIRNTGAYTLRYHSNG